MIVERTVSTCLLGILFWDPVLDRPIRAGLEVRAWPAAQPESVRSSFCTRSGVHAWIGLPGMLAHERRDGLPTDESPQATSTFVIEVRDPQRRFVDVAFEQELPLPYAGPFRLRGAGSPSTSAPGVVLFSATTRPRPAGMASLFGELVVEATGAPAAHARVTAIFPDGARGYGLSDAFGRVAIFAAYPPLEAELTGSPIPAGRLPLCERSWSVSVEVAHQPSLLQPLIGTELPDYRRVLAQAAASVFQGGSPDEPEARWTGSLEFGRELVLRSAGHSALIVRPLPSSP